MNRYSEEKIYDGGEDTINDIVDQDYSNKKSHRWLGATFIALLGVGGAAAVGTYAWTTSEAKIEAENSLNEGLLRAGGFDDNGIDIDISGNTDVIKIGCPGTILESTKEDQKSISYKFDPKTMTAYWDVAPQLDQQGQVVETFPKIEFPLSTEVEVEAFIYEDLEKTCETIASN